MEKTATLTPSQKAEFMNLAIEEAKKAEALGEVPIGCVVVLDGQVIGQGHNLREQDQDATAHAEMFAIQAACKNLESWRLEKAQLFVTLEPCPMCSGAMQLARVEEVYFGAYDPKGGACGSLLNILEDQRFNHWAYVEGGILAEECGRLLTEFFRNLRQKEKEAKRASSQSSGEK